MPNAGDELIGLWQGQVEKLPWKLDAWVPWINKFSTLSHIL